MQSNTKECSECKGVVKPVDALNVLLCICLLGTFTLLTCGAWQSWTGFPPAREGMVDWAGIIAYIIFGGLSLGGGLAILKRIIPRNIIGRTYYAFLENGTLHIHQTSPDISQQGPFLGRYVYYRHTVEGDDKGEGCPVRWRNKDWTELSISTIIFQFRMGGIFRRSRLLGVDDMLENADSWRLRSWSGNFTLIDLDGRKLSSISLYGAVWTANNYESVAHVVKSLDEERKLSDNIGSIVAETLEVLSDKTKWRSPQATALRETIESVFREIAQEAQVKLRIPEWKRIARERMETRTAEQPVAAKGGVDAVASA